MRRSGLSQTDAAEAVNAMRDLCPHTGANGQCDDEHLTGERGPPGYGAKVRFRLVALDGSSDAARELLSLMATLGGKLPLVPNDGAVSGSIKLHRFWTAKC